MIIPMLFVAATAHAERKLSVDELKDLSLRSPNVFDTYFAHQRMYDERLPRGFFEDEAVVGPTYEISEDGVATPVQVAAGHISAGSVPRV